MTNTAVVYKNKKGFMPVGMLAIAVAVSIAGCLLSFLYLKINAICPSVYLCVAAAFGFGAAMGGIAYFLISVMKIRSQSSALIGIIIGCLVFNIFKWALYVKWDNDKIYEDKSAFEVCEFEYDFADADGNIYDDKTIEAYMGVLKSTNAYEYFEATYDGGASRYIQDIKAYNGSDFTIEELKDTSSFDFFYKDYVKKGKELDSIKEAYDMDYIEYATEYLGNYPTVAYLITHPSEFIDNIKFINMYGRWTVGNSYSSQNNSVNSSQNNNVKGIFLWLVWLGELLLICIPAILIAFRRAARPFIEYENDWAEINDSDGFMLRAPANGKIAGNNFKANPFSVLANEHLITRPGTASFMKIKLYHSKDYEENYADLLIKNYNPKNKNYNEQTLAKYVFVSKSFVYNFFKHCGQPVPFIYDERFDEYASTQQSAAIPTITPNDVSAPLMAAMASATVSMDSIGLGSESAPYTAENEKRNSISLTFAGAEKIKVIAIVRKETGLGLAEAKYLVESAPSIIKKDVPHSEALRIKRELEAAGAMVDLI